MNGLKQAYSQFTQFLTKPLPFWASPVGILFVATLSWLGYEFVEPIFFVDKPTNIADIAAIRLWILDKTIYIITIFAVAHYAQRLLHKNALEREALLAKAELSKELANEYKELKIAVNNLRHTTLADLPNRTTEIHNEFEYLIKRGEFQGNPLIIQHTQGESLEETLQNAIDTLCNPIPISSLGPQIEGYPTIRETFDQLYSESSSLDTVRNGFVAHADFVSQYRGKLNDAYSTLHMLASLAQTFYQSTAHRIA